MPNDPTTPTTAERRHVGHHVHPYTTLEIHDAEGTMAAAHFVHLLSRQAEIPGRNYLHGFDRWFIAMNAGEESQALQAARDAIREIEAAKHPYAVEITAIIKCITAYIEAITATRDPRYALAITPFAARGGRTLGAALRQSTSN